MRKISKFIPILFIWLFATLDVGAQGLQLILKPVNPFHFGPAQIFTPITVVNNSGITQEISFKVELKSAFGDVLATYISTPYKAKPGLVDLSTMSPALQSAIYEGTGLSSYISQNQSFPGGKYNYCVTANSAQFPVLTSCQDAEIQGLSRATGILPEDKAIIEVIGTPVVQFTWTPCMPARASVKYALTIVEILPEQTALDALTRNPVIHKIEGLGLNNYLYPYTAAPLKVGKKYAWQVECYEKIGAAELKGVRNTAIVSEPREFSLIEKIDKDTIYYAKPIKELNANYVSLKNGELRFTFESEYLQGILDYQILNEKKEKQEATVQRVDEKGNLSDVALVMKGENKYVLSFKIPPPAGFYVLELKDLKGIKYYLKIKLD